MKSLIVAFAAVLAIAAPAFADPPAGTNLNSPEHRWWECWHQPHAVNEGPRGKPSCCSESDGHNVSDDDVRPSADGSHWLVRIEDQWWDVPNNTIVAQEESATCGPEPNLEHRTEAKAWYGWERNHDGGIAAVHFFCFRLPIEY